VTAYAGEVMPAAALPPARFVALVCDSRSSLPAGPAGICVAGLSAHDAGPVHGCAGAASAPQSLTQARAGVGYCGSRRLDGRHGAKKPGIYLAEHTRLCVVVPGSEDSLCYLLEHSLVEVCVSK